MVPSAAGVKTLQLISPSAGNAKTTDRNGSDGRSKASGTSRLGKARPRGEREARERDIGAPSAGIEAMKLALLNHLGRAPPRTVLAQLPCQGCVSTPARSIVRAPSRRAP